MTDQTRGSTSGRTILRSDIPSHIWVEADGSVWRNDRNHGSSGEAVLRRADTPGTGRYRTVFLPKPLGSCLAHRVVWAWLHDECPAGLVVRHLNDDGLDNRPDNLAIGTQTDNVGDALRAGRWGKLTFAQIAEIRALNPQRGSKTAVCVRFGISHTTLRRILLGERW